MGWERRGKKRFYYHTHYFHGKKRRTYLGPQGDPVAELAAVHAALDAIHVELDRRAYAKDVARLRDGPLLAGIDAATACMGRMINGQLPAPEGPEGPDVD
jgi:hypothetical protein